MRANVWPWNCTSVEMTGCVAASNGEVRKPQTEAAASILGLDGGVEAVTCEAEVKIVIRYSNSACVRVRDRWNTSIELEAGLIGREGVGT